MNKGGRPSIYSDELADRICDLLMSGESLRGICRRDDFPAVETVVKWLAKADVPPFDDFYRKYVRAREVQAELFADDLTEIADDEASDVNRAKLRVDTRKWVVSKMLRRYGDRQTLQGVDGGAIQIVVSGRDASLI